MIKIFAYQSILFFLLIICSFHLRAQFSYISPLPGSKHHNPQVQLIFRAGDLLDESSVLQKNLVEIFGSESGKHDWTSILSEGRTLIIKPNTIFAWGETVNVIVHSLPGKKDGSPVDGTSFSFTIRNEMTAEEKAKYEASQDEDGQEFDEHNAGSVVREDCSLDSLPGYEVTINSNAAPGQIFYNNQSDDKKDTNSFPAIINNDGSLVWACDLGLNGHDFKINYNGYLTYFNYEFDGWVVLDSNFNTIDSVQCGNGYEAETNGHDIVMYPDGHTFVIAYNPQTIDMSQIVEGGKTDALVKGLIIQELDANKQVIFEWRSWDHFLITDAMSTEDLTLGIVDPIHGNTVERDNDGNLLLSSRNMSEITKINLETGDFVWRMGGENNQFTFVNDNIPENFSYQHDIRRLPNGNVTLFNNGVHLPVQRSSAKEYQLDEVNKVATLVWYYEHPMVGPANVFGTGSGSVQRLANGNTIISWGKTINSSNNIPNFTEVDTDNNITWEFKFDEGIQRGYRVHRYEWNPCEMPRPDQITIKKITDVSAVIDWNAVNNAIAYDVQYRKLSKVTWKLKNTTNTSKKLINLKPENLYEFQLRTYCQNGYVSDWTLLDTFMTNPQRTTTTEPLIAFNVYPNPTSGILNFNFETESGQPVFISCYDLTGKLFLTSGFNLFEEKNEVQLDVTSLPVGFYLAEVKTESGSLIQKFIKQ